MPDYTIHSKYATVIALDQHARSVTASAIDLSTGESRSTRMTNCPSAEQIVSWVTSWATKPMRFAYESGPCGFQLARDIRALGCDCDVIAVSSIPRSTEAKRMKDDRNDANSLLEALINPKSKCKAVWIPSESAEAARDLVRAYYDAVQATKVLKLQTSAMLLRHGFIWNERTPAGNLRVAWTRQYIAWAKSVELPEEAERSTLKFYIESTLTNLERCNEIRKKVLELAESPRFKPYVDALTRLKGVDDVTALAYCATVDDFSRFKRGRSVSRYFGLVPTRSDSGEKTGHNGPITKAGDTTVRRAVVEGIASIPNFNSVPKWERKGHEVSVAIEAEAIKCNQRNRSRYRDMVKAGKKPNVAKVAVASEMVRQMWVLGMLAANEQTKG